MEQTTPQNSLPPAAVKNSIKKEFFCDLSPCAVFRFKIGKAIASGLSGFIAGVIVTAIVLLPWMIFLGKLCPSTTR
ncbi:MAG: hypothetical protein WCT10_04850 [Patescibacteria group bacterium]|jgi:hypothetical protein